jgi:hypothetical protein
MEDGLDLMPVYTDSTSLDELMKAGRKKKRSNVISSGTKNDSATQRYQA